MSEVMDKTIDKAVEVVKGRARGRGKVRGKMRQVIWLHPNTYAKVYAISEKLEVAPNVTCEAIIEAFFDLVVNASAVEKSFLCPKCGKEFKSVVEWYDHLKYRVDELSSLIQDLVSMKLEGRR
jgi:predicted RNA-binding Zn-ribbon protein involved in translation (DUF1610 family)